MCIKEGATEGLYHDIDMHPICTGCNNILHLQFNLLPKQDTCCLSKTIAPVVHQTSWGTKCILLTEGRSPAGPKWQNWHSKWMEPHCASGRCQQSTSNNAKAGRSYRVSQRWKGTMQRRSCELTSHPSCWIYRLGHRLLRQIPLELRFAAFAILQEVLTGACV